MVLPQAGSSLPFILLLLLLFVVSGFVLPHELVMEEVEGKEGNGAAGMAPHTAAMDCGTTGEMVTERDNGCVEGCVCCCC